MEKFPENAKRVFHGVIFDVYQWEQKMFDGTTEIFERLERPDSVEVIATTPEGTILIQRQQQPDQEEWFTDVIAGRVESGEDHLEGAKRETLEETGYTSDEWELIDTYSGFSKIVWTMSIFVARNCQKTAEQNLDAGERIEVREVTFDEFIDLVDSHKMKRVSFPIRERCIRAKYDPIKKEEFRKEIFGDL